VDGIQEFLKEFDWSKLAIVVLFALPGFISLRVWAQIVPSSERPFKDEIGEAIGFGILNAMVCAPFFILAAPQTAIGFYGLSVLTLVTLPAVWPFVLRWFMSLLRRCNLLLVGSRSAWDDVFLRGEPYFVIVHLKDGGRAGGFYGSKSFAGLHPISGHLYLEELWYLDKQGKFRGKVPGTKGLVLRPDDYKYVELLEVPMEHKDDKRKVRRSN
jgi:Family of unknown function (DUF6338)